MNLKLQRFSALLLFVCLQVPLHAQTHSKLTKAEIDALLNAHNKARAEAGISPLVWSDKLADTAQEWANTLAHSHQFKHRQPNNYGENLYQGVGGSQSIVSACKSWIAESKHYDGGGVNSHNVAKVGHYTQMIWGHTRSVGAGKAMTPDGRFIVCCNYDPPGNVAGMRPLDNLHHGTSLAHNATPTHNASGSGAPHQEPSPNAATHNAPKHTTVAASHQAPADHHLSKAQIHQEHLVDGELDPAHTTWTHSAHLEAGKVYTVSIVGSDLVKAAPIVKVLDTHGAVIVKSKIEKSHTVHVIAELKPPASGDYRIVTQSDHVREGVSFKLLIQSKSM